MFYRITYNNIGIYKALKQNISIEVWKSLLQSDNFNWLPKPPEYLLDYISYFTELGFNKFYQNVLPICKKYLNSKLIKIKSYIYITDTFIYVDDYQVIINKNIKSIESKFNQLYLQIINDDRNFSYDKNLVLTKTLKQLYPIKHTFLDLNEIVNETIKTPELTPVPDEVLIECYKNLNKISNECFKISYQKIINIVKNSSYLLSNTFIKCLNKYAKDKTGNLYIIKTNIDINKNLENNLTYQKLIKIIPDKIRVIQFLNILIESKQKNKNLNGLTIIKRQINIEKYKDCLIFLENSNMLFKDTLEHEFTHFIQRVCMFDPNLPKIFSHELNDHSNIIIINIIDKIIKFFRYTNEENKFYFQYNLYNFIQDKFKYTEQHQSIKSMMKFFIRTYEKDKQKYLFNYKYYNISQIESFFDKNIIINFRISWLNKFFNKINSYEIFNNSILEDYLNNKIAETREVTLLLFSIIYLVTKYEYIEYNIDEKLINEFKTFKFRDF